MPSFTAPTYDQPIPNLSARVGQDGEVSPKIGDFPVGKIVYICESDETHETTQVMGNFSAQECSHGVGIKAGSGDNGFAIFRRGLTYEVTASEETILTAGGYTVV